jgi:DNA-binding CsgD family transcriptional regulator
LQIRSLTARRKFDESIARMHDVDARALGFQPKPILVDCPESDRRLVIYLLPITPPLNSVEHFLTHTRAIALVIEQKANEPADPATVRDVLGITLGEARVAALIGSGLAPRAAAEKLGIAEETARGVLKRVFAKLGVSRQSELAALLSKLVLR